MTHFSLDLGQLDALAYLVGQKTIKTACGVRVPLSAVVPSRCDCAGCMAIARKTIAASLWLASEDYGSPESREAVRVAAVALQARLGV